MMRILFYYCALAFLVQDSFVLDGVSKLLVYQQTVDGTKKISLWTARSGHTELIRSIVCQTYWLNVPKSTGSKFEI
jgi:hypothetical protein